MLLSEQKLLERPTAMAKVLAMLKSYEKAVKETFVTTAEPVRFYALGEKMYPRRRFIKVPPSFASPRTYFLSNRI